MPENKRKKPDDFCIPKAPFRRLVREIASEYKPGIRFQPEAMMALQEVTEVYLTELFANTKLCAMHDNRRTIAAKDMQLARKIKGDL